MVPLGALLGFFLTVSRVRQDRQESVTRAMGTAGVIVQELDREVRALKDPNKPGQWNREAELSLLSRAIDRLMEAAVVDIELVHNLWGKKVSKTEIARRLVEANVTLLKSRVLPAVPPASAASTEAAGVNSPSA